jgi:hypothetical protein
LRIAIAFCSANADSYRESYPELLPEPDSNPRHDVAHIYGTLIFFKAERRATNAQWNVELEVAMIYGIRFFQKKGNRQ